MWREWPGPAVHRTIVVVDVEGFGDDRRTSAHQVAVRAGLYRVLRQAFEHAGVSWDACDHEDRGDGVFVLAPAETPKAPFVDEVPLALVKALREHNTTHADAARIRLRMALHAGEVTYDAYGVTATAVNLAFRLLDAAPLKSALAESPGVLAMITSGWFFDEVVRHSPAGDAATYRPVRVTVKETSTMAWITLPDHPYPPSTPHRFDELPVPRQLPLAIRDFTSRTEHLDALDALLTNDNANQAVVITAIDGTAGVGKTTLAVHWAHRVQHQFPDGTLYVNLRGYGPGQPATPAEVLDSFLRTLGCPPQQIPIGLEAQSALYRSLLAERQVLIVLDNANAAQTVRPLLPGSPGCLVLITSRASLTGLVVSEAAARLALDLFSSAEALDLVRGIVGDDQVAAEPHAVMELIRICARLPLALRIAASRLRHSIADVVAELGAGLDALSTPGDEPTSVCAVFNWSYQRLNPSQARLFRRLGLHPGPEISLYAAAAVADLDLPETRLLLEALTDAHLLEPIARNRYRLHDLLRAYATDRAEHHDPSQDRDRGRRTLLEWYAHHSAAAYRAFFPADTDDQLLLIVNTHADPPITFSDIADAWTWLETEQENLLAAAHHAANHQLPEPAILICHTSSMVRKWRGEWNAALDLGELGLAVARRSGNRYCECRALVNVAEVQHEVRQWADAVATGQEALELAQALGEPYIEALALNDLGRCCIARGRYAEAIDYLRPALPLSSGAQRGRFEGVIEGNLGSAHIGQGHYEQALYHLERSLNIRRQAGDWAGEPYALGQIARARQAMGAHPEAIALCEQALSMAPDHAYPPSTAGTLDTLGRSLQHVGDMERAMTCWHKALEIFDRFGDPRAEEVRARLGGELGVVAGEPVFGAHVDADHAFGGAGRVLDVGVGAFGAEVAVGEGPALVDGDGVVDGGDRAFG